MKIDWSATALKIGSESRGGTEIAQNAIVEIFGSEAIEEAVDYYFSYVSGSELVRSVLILLRPLIAMDYCMKIYREDEDAERRRASIELLRNIADRRAFAWVPELLSDPDPRIQSWGANMVDQLLFAGFIESEDCGEILETMKKHSNPSVRYCHELILQHLLGKEDNCEQGDVPLTSSEPATIPL